MGPLQGPHHTVRVAGDAPVAGEVRLARARGGLALHARKAAALEVAAGARPSRVRTSRCRSQQLRCSARRRGAGRSRRSDNDNASIRLAAASSPQLFEADASLLPCGRYFVDDIYARAHLLYASRDVALYVRNGIVVENTGALTIRLATTPSSTSSWCVSSPASVRSRSARPRRPPARD